MSHSVTIRTHEVTTGSSGIFLNTNYLRTWNAILKLLQLALGIVCIGIVGHEFNTYYNYNNYNNSEEIFFLLVMTTFMIGTFILFVSCMVSPSTATIISKTIYDLLYHTFAFALLLAGSLTLLVHVNNYRHSRNYELFLGASICGLVNAVLYLISAIVAGRNYRGI